MSDHEPQLPSEFTPSEPAAVEPQKGRRLRSFYERASTTAAQRYQEAEQARERSRTAGFAFGLRDRDLTVNGRLLAGALAFQSFLFLVPVMAALAALGLLHTDAGEWKGGLGLFAREMTSAIDVSITTRIVTLVVSLIAGAWAGFGLLRSFRAVYAMVWDVSPGKLRLHGSLVAAFLGAFAIMAGSQIVAGWLLSGSQAWAFIAVPLISVVSSMAAWILLSTYLPRRAGTTWRTLLPGAAVLGIGFGLLRLFTRVYQTGQLDRASNRYGSLGLAVVMLAWLYFSARLFVLAPEVAATLDEQRERAAGAEGR